MIYILHMIKLINPTLVLGQFSRTKMSQFNQSKMSQFNQSKMSQAYQLSHKAHMKTNLNRKVHIRHLMYLYRSMSSLMEDSYPTYRHWNNSMFSCSTWTRLDRESFNRILHTIWKMETGKKQSLKQVGRNFSTMTLINQMKDLDITISNHSTLTLLL